jgi:Trypsin-like peptidase domain
MLAMLLTAPGAAQTDPRASVLEIEWRTPTGYERCAAVVTARRAQAIVANTAGHCATQPFTVVRFFDGHMVYGSAVRVTSVSESADAATLLITLDPVRARTTPVAVPSRSVPVMGSTLTIVGHPVSALRGPNEGRWTVTYGRMGETAANPETNATQYEVYCSRCGPGDSGSGVFDGEGRLVGIVFGVTQIENVAGGRLPDGLYADVIPVAALR